MSEQRERQYSIDVNVPVINIQSDVIANVNQEIDTIFNTKLKTIKSSTELYTVYNVSYTSYVENNTLSLAIRATLKEGNNPQRVIVQTYNYNLEEDRMLELAEVVEHSNVGISNLQSRINKEITNINKQNQALEAAGYTVFKRTSEDSMYKVENSNNFYLSQDGYLYVIYAYGNSQFTSELDLIII